MIVPNSSFRPRKASGAGGGGTSFFTTFPANENPISEGGIWLQFDASDQTVVQTTGGAAYGTQQTGVPLEPFDDSAAHMAGFGTDYEVETTVIKAGGLDTAGREVEILLRWSTNNVERSTAFGPTHSNGYEINVSHRGRFANIGRFKGAALVSLGDNTDNSIGFTPANGDKFRCRVVGQLITCYWNDVQFMQTTDNDAALKITTGDPGIGFFARRSLGALNTDFGFSDVRITRL